MQLGETQRKNSIRNKKATDERRGPEEGGGRFSGEGMTKFVAVPFAVFVLSVYLNQLTHFLYPIYLSIYLFTDCGGKSCNNKLLYPLTRQTVFLLHIDP